MPERVLALIGVELKELEGAVGLERAGEVPVLAVDLVFGLCFFGFEERG